MPSQCPSQNNLERFLFGQLSTEEAIFLETHLQDCSSCLSRLEQLPSRDAFVDLLRKPLSPDPLDQNWTKDFADRLKRLVKAKETATVDQPLSSEADDIPSDLAELKQIGSYAIERILGAGGMGVVYCARDTNLHRQVAIKVMRREQMAKPSAKDRFLREAQVLASFQHDNIVSIYQAGRQDDLLFLVMPLLQGESLESRLHRERRLPIKEIQRIGEEIAHGLAAAHARGIIHRDVKPSNIWLEAPNDRVKLLDFGLAQEHQSKPITQSGMVLGTPGFLAPEQILAEEVTERADLFSLGCVLYQMATGHTPFRKKSPMATLVATTTDEPVPIRDWNANISEETCRLIHQLLEKDPAQRPPSAENVAIALKGHSYLKEDHTVEVPEIKTTSKSSRWVTYAAGAVVAAMLVTAVVILKNFLFPQVDPEIPLAKKEDDNGKNKISKRKIATQKNPQFQQNNGRDNGKQKVVVLTTLDDLRSKDIPEAYLKNAGFGNSPPPELVGIFGEPEPRPVLFLGSYSRPVTAIAVAPRGKQFAVGVKEEVQIWDVERRTILHKLPHPARILQICYSPNENYLITVSQDGSLILWEANSAKRVHIFPQTVGRIDAITISPDGKFLAAASIGARITVFEIPSGKQLQGFRDHKLGFVKCLQFGPNGKELATAGFQVEVNLWDWKTATKVRSILPNERKHASCLAFSPDGKYLAVGGGFPGKLIRVWSMKDKQAEPLVLSGHGHKVESLGYRPNGQLVSSDMAGRVICWQVKDEHPASVVNLQSGINDCALTADGRYALTAQSNGAVYVLRLQEKK